MAEYKKPASLDEAIVIIDELHGSMETIQGVVNDMLDKVEQMAKDMVATKKVAESAGTKAKGLFGGKRVQTPMKDLLTGDLFISKAAVGKKYAASVGKEPTDTFAWYTVMTKMRMPKENKAGVAEGAERFVPCSEEEANKIRADIAAQTEKERQEAQNKLDAEETLKNKTAGTTGAATPAGTPAGTTIPAANVATPAGTGATAPVAAKGAQASKNVPPKK